MFKIHKNNKKDTGQKWHPWESSRFGRLFCLKKWNNYFKNPFCVYRGYLCVILKSVWWSESFKCDKYAKKIKIIRKGAKTFTHHCKKKQLAMTKVMLFYESLFSLALLNINLNMNLAASCLWSQVHLTTKEGHFCRLQIKVACQPVKGISAISMALGLRRSIIRAIISKWKLFGIDVNLMRSINLRQINKDVSEIWCCSFAVWYCWCFTVCPGFYPRSDRDHIIQSDKQQL